MTLDDLELLYKFKYSPTSALDGVTVKNASEG